MKRTLRLILIALLEFVWIAISFTFFVLFVWGSVQAFGWPGIISGILLSLLAVVGIGGLIFLLVEIYYTLRSIEHNLDSFLELKTVLEKLIHIQYQTYEMFHEHLSDAPDDSEPE